MAYSAISFDDSDPCEARGFVERCLLDQLQQLLPPFAEVSMIGSARSPSAAVGTVFDTALSMTGDTSDAMIDFCLLYSSKEVLERRDGDSEAFFHDLMGELANQFVGSLRARIGSLTDAGGSPLPQINALDQSDVSELIERWMNEIGPEMLFCHTWAGQIASKGFRFSARVSIAGDPSTRDRVISDISKGTGDEGVITFF